MFWSGLTLVALSAALWGSGQQFLTYRFVETQGEILESEVVDQGKTDGFRVSYRYSHKGTSYESTRLRYGGGNGESGDWAIKMKAQFAAGSKIPVFLVHLLPTTRFWFGASKVWTSLRCSFSPRLPW
jgi:hypothetical protein